MKILKLDDITGAVSMPLKKGTLQFLQDSYKEGLSSVLIGLIGSTYDPDTVYILYGVVNSSTAPTYTISEGAAFYQGEIYLIDSASFTATGTDTAVLTITTTQYTTNADPVQFTDLTTHNVHDIRKIVIAAGASGSGIADHSQIFPLDFTIPAMVNITGAGAVTVSGTYPNIVITVPANLNRNQALYSGSFPVGNVSGGQSYSVTFATIGVSDYLVMGSLEGAATDPAGDANVIWIVKNKTATGFTLYVRELSNSVQNLTFKYILYSAT